MKHDGPIAWEPFIHESNYKSQIDQWDQQHAWHPFTQMQDYLEWPITQLESAKGVGFQIRRATLFRWQCV